MSRFWWMFSLLFVGYLKNQSTLPCFVTGQEEPEQKVLLVKIGGSSITNKGEKETLDEESLRWFAESVAKSISQQFRSPQVSKCKTAISSHPPGPAFVLVHERGTFGPFRTAFNNDDAECKTESPRHGAAFVLVHGAGSFGHFTAKEFGFKGHLTEPSIEDEGHNASALEQRKRKQGLAETRLSVQKLNRIVVETLLEYGVNAVGISPCFGVPGMEAHLTLQPDPIAGLERVIRRTIEAGLVPVLHGETCLYGNDVGILSGDHIVEALGLSSWVDGVIFITDVDGVYNEDPRGNPNAQLLRHIFVDKDTGVIQTKLSASGSSHKHDVTGGLKTKLQSAATIVASGKNVTIVKVRSPSAEHALAQADEIETGSLISCLD